MLYVAVSFLLVVKLELALNLLCVGKLCFFLTMGQSDHTVTSSLALAGAKQPDHQENNKYNRNI